MPEVYTAVDVTRRRSYQLDQQICSDAHVSVGASSSSQPNNVHALPFGVGGGLRRKAL